MVFELHIKRNPRILEGYLKINCNYIIFPDEVINNIKETNIEIYLDYENKRMGFLLSNDKIKGFKIRKKGKSASSHITFVHKDQSINGLYKYNKEKDMLVINVPNLNKNKLF